jgi:hypothetical protein
VQVEVPVVEWPALLQVLSSCLQVPVTSKGVAPSEGGASPVWLNAAVR